MPDIAEGLVTPIAGGTLEVEGSDGRRLTLDVPPFSVRTDTAVSMTCLQTPPPHPFAKTVFEGVEVRPFGLGLMRPATLTYSPAPGHTGDDDWRFVAVYPSSIALPLATEWLERGALRTSALELGTFLVAAPTGAELLSLAEEIMLPTLPNLPQPLDDYLDIMGVGIHSIAYLSDVDPARAGEIRERLIRYSLRDAPGFLDYHIPTDPCTAFFDSLYRAQKAMGSLMTPLFELMEYLESLPPEEVEAYEDPEAVEALCDEFFGFTGSAPLIAQLGQLGEQFDERVDGIAQRCPPMKAWSLTATIQLHRYVEMVEIAWEVDLELAGRFELLIHHRLRGSVAGTRRIRARDEPVDPHHWCESFDSGPEADSAAVSGSLGEEGTLDLALSPESGNAQYSGAVTCWKRNDGELESYVGRRLLLLPNRIPAFWWSFDPPFVGRYEMDAMVFGFNSCRVRLELSSAP